MQDFKNLTVWQAARRFTRSLYQLTADFPASEKFGLKAQMRRASISICSNIAEGCGRRGDREFRRFSMSPWDQPVNSNAS
jgi:four helix bundle protein